ncbi:MAG: winged helix-turn-helix domain-containing protein [Anaerolineae bacterium]|nr:winged helix-turn-helix domain-containing protein [Anaerolineae bacterium]
MGQRIKIDWQETAGELKQMYKQERHPQRRTRLQALWHLCCGRFVEEVANIVGVTQRSIQSWLSWYRQGGLTEVLRRVAGHGSDGAEPYLSDLQQRALAAKVQWGEFRTAWDAVQWVQDRWGISYTYKGMYALLQRHDLKIKVPRPRSEKANLPQQDAWKKGASGGTRRRWYEQNLLSMAL